MLLEMIFTFICILGNPALALDSLDQMRLSLMTSTDTTLQRNFTTAILLLPLPLYTASADDNDGGRWRCGGANGGSADDGERAHTARKVRHAKTKQIIN